jgi:Omp85 superfamily domain
MGREIRTPRKCEVVYRSLTFAQVLRGAFIACLGVFSLGIPCKAQENQRVEELSVRTASQENSANPPGQDQQPTAPDQAQTKPKKKKKKFGPGEFVVAPLPISSPAIGSGIVPIVGYIFPLSMKDKNAPPSVIGGAGLITNNGSRGFAIGGDLYLRHATYRLRTGFVHGNIDYNIYGTGIASNVKLPLQQTGEAFFVEFLRVIGWKFYLGPRYFTGHSILTLNPTKVTDVPIPPNLGIQTTLRSLGARLTRDTTTNRFYPTNGTFFTFTSDFVSQALGSKYTFQTYNATFNQYIGLTKNQVLAYNGLFCATFGLPPFYGNCIYGTNNELRGYVAGRYFTRYSLATQLEYRLVLPKRFGLVAFGGIGGVIPGGSQLIQRVQSDHFLPAGGAGLRFQLSKAYHVNLRADFAQGVNGHTFSLGVGEAF